MAEQKIADGQDKDIKNSLTKFPYGSFHKGCHLIACSPAQITKQNISDYDTVLTEVKSYSQRIQRMLKNEIEEACTSTVYRHKAYGRGMDIRDAYRADQKYWISRKIPSDIPEMAVSILLDNSCSTEGDRIDAEKKATVLLQDFCQGLRIPCMVAGFYTSGMNTYLTTYSHFDEVSASLRPKIMQMSPNGCNRDGLALRASIQLLEQRPEPIKIQFILSDGKPNANNYSQSQAIKDIQELKKWAKYRNIEILAAAIGDDKPQIKAIYGDEFIDITDLSTLPKTLVKIIKSKIQFLL